MFCIGQFIQIGTHLETFFLCGLYESQNSEHVILKSYSHSRGGSIFCYFCIASAKKAMKKGSPFTCFWDL